MYITLYVTSKTCADVVNTHLAGTYQCCYNGKDKYFVVTRHKSPLIRGYNGILVCWFYRGGGLVRRKWILNEAMLKIQGTRMLAMVGKFHVVVLMILVLAYHQYLNKTIVRFNFFFLNFLVKTKLVKIFTF